MHIKLLNEVYIFLFILTLFIGAYLFLFFSHPSFSVGIVLTEEAKTDLAILSKNAFEESYSNYFDAELISRKMNVKNIRTNNQSYYLNQDFFNELSKQGYYDLNYDFYLIVTSLPIKDWDKGGYGVFGEAEPNMSTTLSSTYYFMDNSLNANNSIKQTAVHEVLHMLGYVHNPFNRNGIMQYITKSTTLKMVPYYEFQLPLRSHIKNIVGKSDFETIVGITQFCCFILIIPIILFFEIILRFITRKITKKKRISNFVSIASFLVGCLAIYFYNYSFIIFILPIIFMGAVHSIYWESKKIKIKIS